MDKNQYTDQFALAEWTKTREQVHLILQAIWKFESTSILGIAGFYAWYLSTSRIDYIGYLSGLQTSLIGGERVSLAWLATAFSVIILHRLKIEYGILNRLGAYTRSIEGIVFRSEVPEHQYGWQTYIELSPPDKFEWREFYRIYRNTAYSFTIILVLSFAFSTYHTYIYYVKSDIMIHCKIIDC